MNITPEQAIAVVLQLIDRAPKNHAELFGAQAAIEKLSSDAKELAALKAVKDEEIT